MVWINYISMDIMFQSSASSDQPPHRPSLENLSSVTSTNLCPAMERLEKSIWVFPKKGKKPKMDGENNGKPYEQMDDLGFCPPIFGLTHIWIWWYTTCVNVVHPGTLLVHFVLPLLLYHFWWIVAVHLDDTWLPKRLAMVLATPICHLESEHLALPSLIFEGEMSYYKPIKQIPDVI